MIEVVILYDDDTYRIEVYPDIIQAGWAIHLEGDHVVDWLIRREYDDEGNILRH